MLHFLGINGKIKYSIQSIDQEYNDFTIDPDNGTIWPHRSLDRETVSSYNLVVVAKDGGRPAASELSTTVQVINTAAIYVHKIQSHCIKKLLMSFLRIIDDNYNQGR